MVSVWDPLRPEKQYSTQMVGQILKGHRISGESDVTTTSKKNTKAIQQYKNQQKRRSKQLIFLHAKELMSHPVEVISPENNLEKAYEMFSQKRYRHIPVVTEGLQIVGILSDRDFLRESPKSQFHEKKVEEVMSRPVLTVNESVEIHLLARIMFEERVGALPIINDDKQLVGIVTRSDILRALSNTEIFQVNA